jgi:WD40 repeat protein
MIKNPFPGPQPYRAGDRDRFFGREELGARLAAAVRTQRAVVLFGPSGAGKSSLMQASVIPDLERDHDFRVIRVDSWPEGLHALAWLADGLFAGLKLGPRPADLPPGEAVSAAIQRAARRSDRPILVYLDQIEQLFYASREPAEADALLAAVDALADLPIRGLQVVLSLREDYLGRLRDRARSRPRLLDNGFRVGVLTVGELLIAMQRTAGTGEPPQAWSREELLPLMLDVRTPGQFASEQAEAQTAYAQIVCRALFAERAEERSARLDGTLSGEKPRVIAAEPIMSRYFESALDDLGPLSGAARGLLEEQLITADGSRTLRTEKELGRAIPAGDLAPVLASLEAAAILHAEQHQGSRYFEIGHDWLARKVFEGKQARVLREQQAEKDRKHEHSRRAELARQKAEADARFAEVLKTKVLFRRVAFSALAVAGAVLVGSAWVYHLKQIGQRLLEEAVASRAVADAERENALAAEKVAAHASLVAGVSQLLAQERLGRAAKLLLEVPEADRAAREWRELALHTAATMKVESTLYGHQRSVLSAAFTPGGEEVISVSADGEVRRWHADGTGRPAPEGDPTVPSIEAVGADAAGLVIPRRGSVVLRRGGVDRVVDMRGEDAVSAAASPDGARVVTISRGRVARLWIAGADPVTLGNPGHAIAARFSPDGKRIALASWDRTVRLYTADGKLERTLAHDGPVGTAIFTPDGARVVTASSDARVRVWRADAGGPPLQTFVVHDHAWRGWPGFAAIDPSGERIVSGSIDGAIWILSLDGKRPPVVREGHTGVLLAVAFDRAGRRIVTASEDNTARIWDLEARAPPIVLQSHRGRIESVGWSPDDRRVVTGSADTTVKIWVADGSGGVTCRGHADRVNAGAWLSGGDRAVTASEDGTVRFWKISPTEGPRAIAARTHRTHAAVVTMDVSPDGASFVTGAADGAIEIWRADGEGEPALLATRGDAIDQVAYSHDGARIAAASDDGTVTVWSPGARDPVASFKIAGGLEAIGAVFSPGDDRLAVVSSDGAIRVYPAAGGDPLSTLRGELGMANAVAWSPDGKQLAAAGTDARVRLYAIEGKPGPGEGTTVRVLEGHGDLVESVAFSRDGKLLLTGSDDNTARLWDLSEATPRPLILTGHDGNLRGAMLDPSGKRILTVSDDTTARIWELDVAALSGRLARGVTECLLPEMRRDFLNEPSAVAEQKFTECERSHGRDEFKPADDVE